MIPSNVRCEGCKQVAIRIVTILLVFAAIIGIVRFIGIYRAWAYMRPYQQMIARGMTQKQVIAHEGVPMETVTDQYSLDVIIKQDRPLTELPPLRGGIVLIYPADPYGDGEGYVLYLVFNRKGVLIHATLGL